MSEETQNDFFDYLEDCLESTENYTVGDLKIRTTHIFHTNKIVPSSRKIVIDWEPRYQCWVLVCRDLKNEKIRTDYLAGSAPWINDIFNSNHTLDELLTELNDYCKKPQSEINKLNSQIMKKQEKVKKDANKLS